MNEFILNVSSLEQGSKIVCHKNAVAEWGGGRAMVFTDHNVDTLYREKIREWFPASPIFVMPAGEEYKNPHTLLSLLTAMAKSELHRNDALVCLGGGVVGDVGGLAAALYMRGITCIQIPTTLLAQVDSSVGGKTAVDFAGVKNLVGVFRQAEKVLVDPDFLETLPPREIRCGLGEIVKHGALHAPLFEKLMQNRERLFDLEFLAEIVPDNIAFKADVVQRDATEKGLRKCLNLGHTTAHAFELCDKKLSHGEYVLIGLIFEAELAKRHCACDEQYLEDLKGLALEVLGEMPALPNAAEAAGLALLDKKNVTTGGIVVTAPVRKGEFALLELPFITYARELEEIRNTLC